jgi:hypothetical protein
MSSNYTKNFNSTLRGEMHNHKDKPDGNIEEDPFIVRPPSDLSAAEEERIEATFNSFGSQGEINGGKFAKFCRDNKLAGSKLSSTDIDLIFAKAKPKGFRKLNYEQFRYVALPMVAEKRGNDLTKMLKHICTEGGGPVFKGTVAEKVRHHDDKDLYTGVYGRGGPTNAHDQVIACKRFPVGFMSDCPFSFYYEDRSRQYHQRHEISYGPYHYGCERP